MTVAYLPGPAAILLRSELRRRPYVRKKKKRKNKKEVPLSRARARRFKAMNANSVLELIARSSMSTRIPNDQGNDDDGSRRNPKNCILLANIFLSETRIKKSLIVEK